MSNNILTIIVPCYNEGENIDKTIPGLINFCRERNYQLIVVNDGSYDNSRELLENYQANFYRVIHHKVNQGYGGAIKTGIRHANTKYIITIDADGQHCLEDIDNLLDEIINKNADMVIGSRVEQRSASLTRGVGKWIIRQVAKTLMPLHIYDLNSGMKIYNREIADKYLYLCPNSMAYSDVIALLFINNRQFVIEKSIKIKERLGGVSTIGYKTAFETIMEIINIVMLFHPLKIFLPLSGFSFMLAVIWGVRCYLISSAFSTMTSMLIITAILLFLMGLIAEQLAEIRRNMHS